VFGQVNGYHFDNKHTPSYSFVLLMFNPVSVRVNSFSTSPQLPPNPLHTYKVAVCHEKGRGSSTHKHNNMGIKITASHPSEFIVIEIPRRGRDTEFNCDVDDTHNDT